MKILLPDYNNTPIEYEVKSNSVIIIGANGSGKSKLGAWIEENNGETNVHRICAQRNLNFSDFIPLKSYEQATNFVLYGNETEKNKGYRWNWGHMTTTLLNDFENVLAALIALDNSQKDVFFAQCRQNEQMKIAHPNTPHTVIDDLLSIWDAVFPHRKIKFLDSKVIATTIQNEVDSNQEERSYKGNEMSDGERVALYLIGQCLTIPQNKILVIDEPEIHLHRSIMNCLWSALEKKRPDCLFVYITHDTQFAASHAQSLKIWVKEFDGTHWILEEILTSGLPEKLLLDIMGNRRKVIFVEGSESSYDTLLYSEIYKNYYVVPCGGCSSVIARVKAMNATSQLHDLTCYGIIDRDFRSDKEIEAYKKHNIFTIKVAEVENLFLVDELLKEVSNLLAFKTDDEVDKVKDYIMNQRFAREINRQICEAIIAEIKYQLSIIKLSNKNELEAEQSLRNAFETISFENVKCAIEAKFQAVLNSKNYSDVLSVFNRKDLVKSIGTFFGLENNDFCDYVIRQLQGKNSQKIINAIIPYLPSEIQLD